MPDLNFAIVGAEAVAYSALPMLNFKLSITNANAEELIQTVSLKCQIMLSATQRHYNPEEKARLFELFGKPDLWGKTLHAFLWTHVTTVVPRFTGSTVVDLPVPCLYDFEVVSTKYFNALEDGDIPLSFLFSGTMFYEGPEGNLQIGQISWSKEATYRLPVSLWKDVINMHFPNSAWLRLPRDLFDQLYHYKMSHGFVSWDQALTQLLQASGEEVKP